MTKFKVFIFSNDFMKYISSLLFFILPTVLYAQSQVAVVKIVKKDASVVSSGGEPRKLNQNDWVKNGDTIKTMEKSFVKLVFIDKSQMNIGPNSVVKVESFGGSEAGVIDMVKGKIRSKVTKDYLKIQDQSSSKLLIKTHNAVMGVRGTDFLISTNGINTSTVLFEGEIVFNKLEDRSISSAEQLEEKLNQGVRIFPGEFSVMQANQVLPTVPARMSVEQFEKLEKNQEFNSDAPSERSPAGLETSLKRSVVPDGLKGEVVANKPEIMKDSPASSSKEVLPEGALPRGRVPGIAEGYVKGPEVKPANGSMIDISSGVIIPPASDSLLDPVTNTFIPSQNSGRVGVDGNYIPPKNMEITQDGKILISTRDQNGRPTMKEIPPPPPVVTTNVSRDGKGPGPGGALSPPQGPPPQRNPATGDIPLPNQGGLDTRFNPTGGIINVNDPTRTAPSPKTETIIIVKPPSGSP